jgi:hypothetical protein
MAVTRREWAGIVVAAAAEAAGAPQQADEETRSAREAMEENARQLDGVPLPMSAEPAFSFKP